MTDKLAVDLYAGDGNFNLEQLGEAGDPWCLVALKLSQGNYYTGSPWAEAMWPRAKAMWGDRYGKTGFRVWYHYLDCAIDGRVQAEFALSRLVKIGDIGYGDPFVMLDVERGGQRRQLSTQQIIDCAAAWIARVHEALGLRAVTYGGEYLRSNGIKISQFGSEYAWVADYEESLRPTHYTQLGVDLPHLLGWQYGGLEGAGKMEVHLKGYPWTTPAGPADLSALTLDGGGQAAIDTLASWCVQSSP